MAEKSVKIFSDGALSHCHRCCASDGRILNELSGEEGLGLRDASYGEQHQSLGAGDFGCASCAGKSQA